jgi:hypothetical protein
MKVDYETSDFKAYRSSTLSELRQLVANYTIRHNGSSSVIEIEDA